MPPTLSSGKNTIATTMIPTPPSHCRIPRQSKIPLGRSSRPDSTVEPVVVSPDIASKKASVKFDPVSPSIKGIAPKIGRASQTPVVRRKVCWIVSPSRTPLAQARAIMPPVNVVISADSAKTHQWPRFSATSTSIGSTMATPSTATNRPMTYPTGRKSSMGAALAWGCRSVKRSARCAGAIT